MNKKAIIFGASGLTGSELLTLLLKHDAFSKVVSGGRKLIEISHPKLEQITADYNTIEQYADTLSGDVLFCCLGTTIKKAGSRDKFQEVDLHYPLRLIKIAEDNHINHFVVISSIGADAASSNFYLQTKGMLEVALGASSVAFKTIVRPSLIMGKRKEFRFGESIAIAMMKGLGWLMFGKLKKYRGINSSTIAKAMLLISLTSAPPVLVESDELKNIVKRSL
jgi:uncharacterized protein YbjT (DUF2867 family)